VLKTEIKLRLSFMDLNQVHKFEMICFGRTEVFKRTKCGMDGCTVMKICMEKYQVRNVQDIFFLQIRALQDGELIFSEHFHSITDRIFPFKILL